VTWKRDGKEANGKKEEGAEESMRDKLKDKKVRCRICDGEHFTARCPFKDTMQPVGEDGAAGGGLGAGGDDDAPTKEGGLGAGGSSYVPPHMRKGAGASAGERMGGKYERDDLATLRVTNVSEFAEEQDLREIFERFGRVTRVFLAKDRETGRAKGFAFISFQERSDAAKACEKIDGCEWSSSVWSQGCCTDSLCRWLRASDSTCGVCEEGYLIRCNLLDDIWTLLLWHYCGVLAG